MYASFLGVCAVIMNCAIHTNEQVIKHGMFLYTAGALLHNIQRHTADVNCVCSFCWFTAIHAYIDYPGKVYPVLHKIRSIIYEHHICTPCILRIMHVLHVVITTYTGKSMCTRISG